MRSNGGGVGGLVSARAAVDALDAPSLDELLELYQLRNQVEAAITRAIAVAEETGATVEDAGLLPRSWLVRRGNRAPGEAGAMVLLARHLPQFPQLRARFTAGAISGEAARVIVRGLLRLHPDDRESAEQILVQAAEALPPPDVALLATEIADRTGANEDALEREVRRLESRSLHLAPTLGGMVAVRGLLDPVAGERLTAAVLALAGDHAGRGDERTDAQRRADALGEIAARALHEGWLPDHGGERPQIVLTIPLADLTSEHELGRQVRLPLTGLTTTVGEVRRLACTAGLIPAVLGTDSQLLDIGRASPMWTTAIRRAARLRDGDRCTFPGCTAGPGRLELHHLTWWSRGGQTCLANSATLCVFHHWLVHRGSWTLHRDTDTGQLVATSPFGNTFTDQPGRLGGPEPPTQADPYPADRQWASNHPQHWMTEAAPPRTPPPIRRM